MFVRNRENIDFKYRKSSYCAVLKANTVSLVDESKVSAAELLACYGQRIEIMAPFMNQETTKVEEPEVDEMNADYINKILSEIEDEAEGNTPVKKGELEVDTSKKKELKAEGKEVKGNKPRANRRTARATKSSKANSKKSKTKAK